MLLVQSVRLIPYNIMPYNRKSLQRDNADGIVMIPDPYPYADVRHVIKSVGIGYRGWCERGIRLRFYG